jgi:hypothetical protein
VPLNSSTVLTPRRSRAGRVVAILVACVAAGAATFAVAADDPAPAVRTTSQPSQPAISRYHDIEASKAVTMRALGRRVTGNARSQHRH